MPKTEKTELKMRAPLQVAIYSALLGLASPINAPPHTYPVMTPGYIMALWARVKVGNRLRRPTYASLVVRALAS